VATTKLTANQRWLATLMLDPDTIIANEDVDGRTPRLELAKDQIIEVQSSKNTSCLMTS
jgi:hypothetical protein